jgi:hypothetical protein
LSLSVVILNTFPRSGVARLVERLGLYRQISSKVESRTITI